MNIEEFLSNNYQYNDDVKSNWRPYIDTWKNWYTGYDEEFHRYTIYNGRNEIHMKRSTLNMAKKCCEDWADLLFNEKCSVSLSDETQNLKLQEILNQLDFWGFMNKSIEKAGALGTGAIILSLDNIVNDGINYYTDNIRPNLSFVDVYDIYPLSWNKNKITECAFVNKYVNQGTNYCCVSVHIIGKSGTYIIKNHMFEMDNVGNIIQEIKNSNVLKEFDTRSNIPWFAIITPNSNNNKQQNSPFGLSFFANSIDILKSIDIGFDSFVNEITLSRKRIFVRDDLIDYGPDGKGHPVFHASDIAVYTLPNGMDKSDLIQAENSDIRATDLEKYLKNMLSIFSDSVGFELNFYTFENNTAVKTATEVISNNNKMYRRKKKHEILLESAIYDIISCLCKIMSEFTNIKLSDDGLTIKFDDSIIEDINSMSLRALNEYKSGIISATEYRQKLFGESVELSKSRYAEVLKEKISSDNYLNKNITNNDNNQITEN